MKTRTSDRLLRDGIIDALKLRHPDANWHTGTTDERAAWSAALVAHRTLTHWFSVTLDTRTGERTQ